MPFQITEAHEDRIQRLEGSMERVVATTAAGSVKIDHLVATVEKGFAAVNARLDQGTRQFDEHGKAIAELNSLETSRSKRWATVKGAVLPLFAVAAGVIATQFGNIIWTWLSSLF